MNFIAALNLEKKTIVINLDNVSYCEASRDHEGYTLVHFAGNSEPVYVSLTIEQFLGCLTSIRNEKGDSIVSNWTLG